MVRSASSWKKANLASNFFLLSVQKTNWQTKPESMKAKSGCRMDSWGSTMDWLASKPVKLVNNLDLSGSMAD